ncbi:uncharacterized protein N7500_008339 [Penicillium coprophilum]|uniref:uncharacterized protein n=1 Tax=Penicillium coprophilum TaxID=36646 RepID=UPI00239EC9BF|nr:uncharacterized protein N7500_008339 [Penicillium coprophilum]KAJ5158688.1 hypothetical protein N7500_008339 [Penicillium coprophilum]
MTFNAELIGPATVSSRSRLSQTANKLACAHITAKLYEKAQDWFKISEEWWHLIVTNGEETDHRPARHIMEHARYFMCLQKYAQAEEMLNGYIPRLKTEDHMDWDMLAQ